PEHRDDVDLAAAHHLVDLVGEVGQDAGRVRDDADALPLEQLVAVCGELLDAAAYPLTRWAGAVSGRTRAVSGRTRAVSGRAGDGCCRRSNKGDARDSEGSSEEVSTAHGSLLCGR